MHFLAPFLVIFHCVFFVGVQFCAAAHVVGRARCALHICLCLCRFLSERAVLPHLSHLFCRGRGGGSKTVSSSYRLRIVTNTNNCELNKSVQRREKVCFSAQLRKGDFFVAKPWLFCVTVWSDFDWLFDVDNIPEITMENHNLYEIYIYMYNYGKICLFDRADICWVLSKKCYLHQTIDWCGQYSFKSHQVGSPMETSIVHTCESFLCPNFPCLVGCDTALCK